MMRETIPLSGAFYSTDGNDFFAHFREEEKAYLALHLAPLNQQVGNAILKDTNLAAIKGTPAYQTNRSPDSPTNRLLPWFPHPYQGSHSWPFACRQHGGLCQH